VLHDDNAIDDAFQATFLVLARRAVSIRQHENLAPWLGRVAQRIARKCQVKEARRARYERPLLSDAATAVETVDLGEQELASLLRHEIDRLPRLDRLLLRLTYWRGKTYEQAARQLSWPIGTVRSRLSRVRDRLRIRLTRRGLVPALAATASAGMVGTTSAAQPSEALVTQTVRTAIASAGKITTAVKAGAVPAAVAALAHGELAIMATISGKLIAALVLVAGLASAGVVSQVRRDSGRGVPVAGPGAPGTSAAQGSGERRTGPLPGAGQELPASNQAAPASQAVDRDLWARKLAALNSAGWREAFAVGEELAGLPADEGFAILKENWKKIDNVEARQQLLKAWDFADHPRLVDGLDLGMRDPSPDVERWALSYLDDLALQDFSENFQAYKDWYQANREKPLSAVVAVPPRRFAVEAAQAEKGVAAKQVRLLQHTLALEKPEAREALLAAGFLRTLERWSSRAEAGSRGEDVELAVDALAVFGALRPGEEELRRVVVPLLGKEKPDNVRNAAIRALGGKENAWAIDLVLDELKQSLDGDGKTVDAAACTLANFDNPRIIPPLIAAIDAHDTRDTRYSLGYFALGRLTGVQYDESHDGPWWGRWWENNKERYAGAVQAVEFPNVQKKPQQRAQQADDDPLADVADIAAQDRRAGGDEMKRYFLIGKDAKPPTDGYRLLIVVPGGDGSADFQPFIRRIRKNALDDRWLIAQAVAPKWDERQFDRIVWPTAKSRYAAAKFTTEEFIEAIVGDVRSKVKINPRRVFVLGWSSGGPPCYATALRKETPVAGAFIAMSVFRPQQLPALEQAKDRAFYLLQSPQDRVTPIRYALTAEHSLQAAGAKVRLEQYEGGHGWQGDVWTMIREGIDWLDQQTGAK
jgi:RNA polymerase sigma factor (sigma-70 family)